MDENKPPYYCIFYKNWRPKPSEDRKRPLKSRDNLGKRVKIKEKCNWDNLPNELKMMCIEKTDFKTRANLMLSNRHNKMLVESIKSKYPLSHVYFQNVRCFNRRQRSYKNFNFFVKSWKAKADYTSKKCELRKLMDVLLNANIDELELECAAFDEVIDKILSDSLATCNKMFTVKSLHLTVIDGIGLDILQHCDEQLEQISVIFDYRLSTDRLETFLKIPQVIAAKRLNIFLSWRHSLERFNPVIAWLLDEVEHDIGKEIIFQKGKPLLQYSWQNSWQFLMDVTETRRDFHHPTEKILCLRTKNSSKRVWAWPSEEDYSLNFLVSAVGSDAPNVKDIEKNRAKERKEYLLKTKL